MLDKFQPAKADPILGLGKLFQADPREDKIDLGVGVYKEATGNTPIVLQTKVQLGDLQNNLYPVISGLKEGDKVAISNTSRLRSGMPVKVSAGGN